MASVLLGFSKIGEPIPIQPMSGEIHFSSIPSRSLFPVSNVVRHFYAPNPLRREGIFASKVSQKVSPRPYVKNRAEIIIIPTPFDVPKIEVFIEPPTASLPSLDSQVITDLAPTSPQEQPAAGGVEVMTEEIPFVTAATTFDLSPTSTEPPSTFSLPEMYTDVDVDESTVIVKSDPVWWWWIVLLVALLPGMSFCILASVLCAVRQILGKSENMIDMVV